VALDPTLSRRQGARTRLRGRAGLRIPRVPPRLLRLLLLILVLAGLGYGGWMWLRDSSLAAVRDVEVTGSTSSEQARVRAALDAAARDMTTLHVREEALRSAVAEFSSVANLEVATDFPHTMRIRVLEHRPVAVLVSGDREIAASGDGLLLKGIVADGDLPVIRTDAVPAGDRVRNTNTKTALALAAAAPDPIRRRIDRMWTGPKGMMLALVDGPDLIFGDASDVRRKWLAVTRVLADPSAAGATYLDVRIPERVAAGGLGPVPEPTPAPTGTPAPIPTAAATPETNPQP
jgi:cell division protein FtsQ